MHPMLTIAVRAARRAGSIINRASLSGGAVFNCIVQAGMNGGLL